MKLTRIFLTEPNTDNRYVTCENRLSPRLAFGSGELERLFRENEAELMQTTEREIHDYINCDSLCGDDEGMFPRRSYLTGEWYLRGITFPDPGFLSIQTAFLSDHTGRKDDYLGLEVVFFYDEASQQFVLDGVNSSGI
ncbi:MAG: hypothetical protein E7559_00710 [Ruminococcaceae bacterium]|nr:hypothetical protein [Oscillospiraceae bacterium]